MGITLGNSHNGVYIKRLNEKDIGYKYLRINDVITHINGIPIFEHHLAVEIINELTREHSDIKITVPEAYKINKTHKTNKTNKTNKPQTTCYHRI